MRDDQPPDRERTKKRIKFYLIPVVVILVFVCVEILAVHLVLVSVGGWQKDSISAATEIDSGGRGSATVPEGTVKVFENLGEGCDSPAAGAVEVSGTTPQNRLKVVVQDPGGDLIESEQVELAEDQVRVVTVPPEGGSAVVSCEGGELDCRW